MANNLQPSPPPAVTEGAPMTGFDRALHWAAHYLVLKELTTHMTSLYQVMQQAHSNNSTCSYLVAVPPDDAIPAWAREKGRVSQGFVRSHLFRQRDNQITGLAENVSAVMKLRRSQPFFSQCPGSDSEEECMELFGACTTQALQDELDARDTGLSAYVFGAPVDMKELKSAPAQGIFTISTPWSSTGKTVGIFAVDQVRNAQAGVAVNEQPFLTLVFIDGSLFCEFDWEAIQMQNENAEVKPGELSSGQHAAAASLRANMNGDAAPAAAAVPQQPATDETSSSTPHSWLSRLYNQIAFATAKPTPPEQRQAAAPSASPALNTARSTGTPAPLDVPHLVLEPSLALAASVGGDAFSAAFDPARRAARTRRSSQSSSRKLSGRTSRGGTSARSAAALDMNDPSKSRIFEVAPMFRALLTIVNEAATDAVLLRLDTELVIFDSTYVCIPGFEQFTVAKVNQIVESLTDDYVNAIATAGRERKAAIERAKEAERIARAKRRQLQQQQQQQGTGSMVAKELPPKAVEEEPVPTSRAAPCPIELSVAEKASLLDGATETDVDIIVTALHTIFTAGVAPVVLSHWRAVHHDADVAFQRQCFRLRRSKPKDFGVDLSDLPLEALEPAVLLISEFDNAYSVFTFMRIAERILAVIVEAMDLWDVPMTADVSIPLIVYLLSQGQPQAMMSTISFVTSFSLQALDMSALGYSFTTVEAAAQQLVQEYNARVAERGEKGTSEDDDDEGDLDVATRSGLSSTR